MKRVKTFLYLLIFPALYCVCWFYFKLKTIYSWLKGFKKTRFVPFLISFALLSMCFYLFLVARPFGHRLNVVPPSEETKIGEDFRVRAADALNFFSSGEGE